VGLRRFAAKARQGPHTHTEFHSFFSRNHWEHKFGLLLRKRFVDGAKRFEFVFEVFRFLWVDVDLEDAGAVEPDADALSNDRAGPHDVLEDRGVDGRLRTRTGHDTARVRATVRWGKDGALRNDDDMFSREFFFQLANESHTDLLHC